MRAAALALALLLTIPAAAQEYKVCRISGRAVYTDRTPFGGEFKWHGEIYWRWMRAGQVHYVTPKIFLRVPQ